MDFKDFMFSNNTHKPRARFAVLNVITCKKEQDVPMVTSRVTFPRTSCTLPDFRITSFPI